MRKVKIKVPKTKRDIKLSQYQKFLRVTKDVEDEKIIHKRMVAVFCNLTDVIINNMTKTSFNETLAHLLSVLEIDKEAELIRTIMLNGKEYGFIPNMDDLTVGELSDLDNFIVDWQNMDKVMGVLYRPIKYKKGDSYQIEDYKTKVSLDLPLDVALSAYFFLNNLLKDLLNYIPNYIEQMVLQDPKSKTLVENGVGINQFTELLEETCLNLRKSLT